MSTFSWCHYDLYRGNAQLGAPTKQAKKKKKPSHTHQPPCTGVRRRRRPSHPTRTPKAAAVVTHALSCSVYLPMPRRRHKRNRRPANRSPCRTWRASTSPGRKLNGNTQRREKLPKLSHQRHRQACRQQAAQPVPIRRLTRTKAPTSWASTDKKERRELQVKRACRLARK